MPDSNLGTSPGIRVAVADVAMAADVAMEAGVVVGKSGVAGEERLPAALQGLQPLWQRALIALQAI